MEYITLGYILKPFGLKGEVRCKSLTSFGSIRFKKGTKVYLHSEKTGERVDATIAKYRDSGDQYFLAFSEFPDINLIEKFKGFAIEIEKEKAIVPEGFYRYDDLIGCKVIDYLDESRVIGNVIDVVQYSVTMNLVVLSKDEKNIYVPFKKDLFIKNVDLENKVISINVMEGLL